MNLIFIDEPTQIENFRIPQAAAAPPRSNGLQKARTIFNSGRRFPAAATRLYRIPINTLPKSLTKSPIDILANPSESLRNPLANPITCNYAA